MKYALYVVGMAVAAYLGHGHADRLVSSPRPSTIEVRPLEDIPPLTPAEPQDPDPAPDTTAD